MSKFKPAFGCQFGSVQSLAKKIGIKTNSLVYVSENIDKYWLKGACKVDGKGKIRKTNDAKPLLKEVHTKLKDLILVPTCYPDFLHGALPGKSIYTNANNHLRKRVLISEDIKGFFPNTTGDVVFSIWKRFYNLPSEVAYILTSLTTYKGVLPQGWKTSSYLANLVFFDAEEDLFLELASRCFIYSRFVDDISVSSGSRYDADDITWVISKICAMFASKNYQLKRSKHSIKTKSSQQTVNNQLVNNHSSSIIRSERKKYRAGIHKLELSYKSGVSTTKKYQSSWRSMASKVGRLRNPHPQLHKTLRERLMAIKP